MTDFDREFLKSRGLIYRGYHLPYNPNLTERAKMLRQNMTSAEKFIWNNLFKKLPFKVYKQRPIDNFIVDFYCSKLKYVFEIDGDYHLKEEIKEYDKMRTLFLEVYQLEIMRFINNEVLNNFEDVKEKILQLF